MKERGIEVRENENERRWGDRKTKYREIESGCRWKLWKWGREMFTEVGYGVNLEDLNRVEGAKNGFRLGGSRRKRDLRTLGQSAVVKLSVLSGWKVYAYAIHK